MITAKAFAGKHYAVYGLARSGQATVEALLASGARVTAWDAKEETRSSLRAKLVGRGTAAEGSGGGVGANPSTIESSFDGPPPRPSDREERRAARAFSFASHAVTLAPLASKASTVAKPERARPYTA